MIEIPESHTLSKQLEETVIGKRITGVIAAHTPHSFAWYYGDPAEYDGRLRGLVIDSVRPHAGYVEMHADKAMILLAEGANLRLIPPGAKAPKKHQLLIELEDGSALVGTASMYGLFYVCPKGGLDNPYYRIAVASPSPLGDGFTAEHFASLIGESTGTLSAKAFLATEQRIPGLGNGCLQDILFAAGIHPKRKMNTFSKGDMDRLYHTLRDKLREMTDSGGRDTEKDLFGRPGGYRTLLSKNTVGTPCPVCGDTIGKQNYLGGSIYFCPTCQPL